MKVVLGIRPRPTTDLVDIMLQAPRNIAVFKIEQATIRFGQLRNQARTLMARPSGRQGYGIQVLSVMRSDLTQLEQDEQLEMDSPVINVNLPLTGLPAVMKMIEECTSGLLERYGLSKEAQARIATFPKPKRNVAAYVTNTDYPPSALRRGAVGEVEARLIVGADGKPSDCQIVRSSGHNDLDERTCAIVTKRTRFEPAVDRDGATMASPFFFSIRWLMPN